jgi:hypothetical protein
VTLDPKFVAFMCTITYLLFGNNNFILTSNRDETPMRKIVPPKTYIENGVELTYSKDELAGGTWVGTSHKKKVVCLLNVAFRTIKLFQYFIVPFSEGIKQSIGKIFF